MQQAGKGCSFPELISVPQAKLSGSPSSQAGNKGPKQKEWDTEIGKHTVPKLFSNTLVIRQFWHWNTIAAEWQAQCQMCNWFKTVPLSLLPLFTNSYLLVYLFTSVAETGRNWKERTFLFPASRLAVLFLSSQKMTEQRWHEYEVTVGNLAFSKEVEEGGYRIAEKTCWEGSSRLV